MAFDKFLIAPIEDGLRNDVKPWLLPDSAFEELNNAYNFRGRIKKRLGSFSVGSGLTDSALPSRLRIKLAAASGTVPLGGTISAIGQMFSVGDETLTVNTLGNPANLVSSDPALSGTFDTTTGAYVINGAGATDIYFYPARPVMGFANYEQAAINDERLYAFDQNFFYRLFATGWEAVDPTDPNAQWTGSDSQFFWSTTWRAAAGGDYVLFTTNFNTVDQLRYYDGAAWASWNPQYASLANNTIETARIIIQYRNRLLLINTVENDNGGNPVSFVNRIRYSTLNAPLNANAYREDIAGEGSFLDVPTREAIVSAIKIKNRLILFCERSTYELVYTQDETAPFTIQQINSTLGCESTFSVIPFDKVVLGIGQDGIHACTGANVERIDSKIPDEIFQIHNEDDGVFRVHGIRDYYNELTYWAMPSRAGHEKFPNTVLVFNYNNRTWARFDDSITAFGYYQNVTELTWQEIQGTWEDWVGPWNSGEQESKFRYTIAGNQQGFTFVMSRSRPANATSQQITNITIAASVVTITSINHNLTTGDWVQILNAKKTDGTLYTELNDKIFKIKRIDDDNFTIDEAPSITGTYGGNGALKLVSKVDIRTKRFNFYTPRGRGSNIQKIDFLVNKVDDSELTIDYLPSGSQISLREAGIDTQSILGTGILELSSFTTLEEAQETFWHAVYMQAQGESVQLRIYYNDSQMSTPAKALRWFEIHGILFHASPIQDI